MKIVLIAGTNRAGSKTLQFTQILERRYAAIEGVDTQLLDLSQLPPETFSPSAYDNKPAEVSAMSDAVLSADGLVVVTPEYNGSFPGALKLFIDLLPFPKRLSTGRWPLSVWPPARGGLATGRAASGGVWLPQRPHVSRALFFRKVGETFDFAAGRAVDDFTEGLLQHQITGFVDFIAKLKG